jgi:hypothetical protein
MRNLSSFITEFYRLPSFEHVIEHDLNGTILAHNNMFYLYHPNGTGFTLFDKNGQIVRKIERYLDEIADLTIIVDLFVMSFFQNTLNVCLGDNRICRLKINKSLIDYGFIYFMESERPKNIELDYDPCCIVELKDKNILVGSCEDDLLALYDSEFNLIRTITQISNKEIKPTRLACDQDGNVFMTNEYYARRLYKLNSEFELIKSIGSYGSSIRRDITIHENKIYVCVDGYIRVYSLDLEKLSEHHFEDTPLQIRISTDMACVQFSTTNGKIVTEFYKLPSFDSELVVKHDLAGPILAHKKMFYLYHVDGTGFTLFHENGKKMMTKRATTFGRIEDYDTGMSFFNNSVYMRVKRKTISKLSIRDTGSSPSR